MMKSTRLYCWSDFYEHESILHHIGCNIWCHRGVSILLFLGSCVPAYHYFMDWVWIQWFANSTTSRDSLWWVYMRYTSFQGLVTWFIHPLSLRDHPQSMQNWHSNMKIWRGRVYPIRCLFFLQITKKLI